MQLAAREEAITKYKSEKDHDMSSAEVAQAEVLTILALPVEIMVNTTPSIISFNLAM